MHPAQQTRSQATHDALLQAGRSLLATRDFDSLSVAEIAAGCRLSVGSFYGRFRDKEAFFSVLQEVIAQQWLDQADRSLADHARAAAAAPADTPHTVAAFAGLVIDMFRRDAGFFRAALKHASTHPSSWSPIKQAGRDLARRLEAALDVQRGRPASTAELQRIRFAVQVLYGTGINAVLNDPGPLQLHHPQLARELALLMGLYLDAPQAQTASVAKAARPAKATPPAKPRRTTRAKPSTQAKPSNTSQPC